MKKYFLGLIAIVCAVAFSAFTKPYTMQDFKLLTNPVSANIVNDASQWSISGTTYGDCVINQADLACTISLNETKSAYFHQDESERTVLNTFEYANAQSTKQDYLEITETIGLNPDRIISSIQPKHFNGTSYENANLGSDLTFKNAKD